MSKTAEEVTVAGVRLSSPDRVLYAGQGIRKQDLAAYYERIAEWVLPHLAGRPLTLLRCPRGQETECFVQRRASESFPSFIRRVEVPDEEGTATYVVVESLPGLVYLVQIGVLEIHTWGARRDRLDRPDRMILDLDPDEKVPWADVMGAAREVRERLSAAGLESFVKTSGGKGLHVVVPLERRHSWDEVREFSHALAGVMAADAPERYLAQASKAERSGKVYVDYLRNAWSASAVAAYSSRAKPGATVSTPLGWDELGGSLRPEDFTVKTVPQRLESATSDPWEDYGRVRQRISRASRKQLGLDR